MHGVSGSRGVGSREARVVQVKAKNSMTGRAAVTAGLAASLLLAAVCVPGVRATDFSQAKQVYVPPSRIPRRFDFAAIRERAASVFAAPQSVNTGFSSPRAGSGLVPPPPATPAFGAGAVPAPPPMGSFMPTVNTGGPVINVPSISGANKVVQAAHRLANDPTIA